VEPGTLFFLNHVFVGVLCPTELKIAAGKKKMEFDFGTWDFCVGIALQKL
jgi:hypothetical protein